MEEKLQRPLNWIVCLLHLNEIAFNTIFTKEDGGTCSATKYSGSIGKQLKDDIWKEPITEFQPISLSDMPDGAERVKLRNDQKYLLDLAKAVSSGVCHPSLAEQKPFPQNVARWLSTAARLLRLYMSSSSPSDALRKIVLYVMKVYIPLWFRKKWNEFWADGGRHIFALVSLSRQHCPEFHSKYIKEIIGRNNYFIHPENLLISMITDADKEIRDKGYRKIMEARRTSSPNLRIYEKLEPDEINFSCRHYSDILNWDNVKLYEPPFTKTLPLNQLERYAASDDIIPVPNIPLHTQATERFVRVVNEAVKNVANVGKQNSYAHNKVNSRKKMPALSSKRDYKCGE